MLASYFLVLVFILVGLAAGVLFILLGTILGPKHHYAEKLTCTARKEYANRLSGTSTCT